MEKAGAVSTARPIYRQAMGWILGLVIFGLLIPGINKLGARRRGPCRYPACFFNGLSGPAKRGVFIKILAGICTLLTIAVLLWAVFQALYFLLRYIEARHEEKRNSGWGPLPSSSDVI